MYKRNSFYFPSEWYPQSAIQLTWPHAETDWNYMLDEITACFINLARTILQYQKLIVVCPDIALVKAQLELNTIPDNLILVELETNDTWARDHAGISVLGENKEKYILDFTFNGWGLKFASNFDNQITRGLFTQNIFQKEVQLLNRKDFVFEGGAIESDGKGTLLTTSECLLSPNRNSFLTQSQIEENLLSTFGAERVLWLDYGFLEGDDTDSHIDTLARFCDEHTIVYVKCEDKGDIHYEALSKMEEQLRGFVDYQGNPYELVPLPMADKVVFEGERLPATYANFLIMNNVVLIPFYNSSKDLDALKQLEKAFPNKKLVGVDCLPIIKQHGSLHCVTMQYPEGFV
ncbi:MAG: agmatine deiminase family protein [Dysgonomonas sp.]|nr:agmatine deiminase family protein [Dysgonomonas sp.]